MEKSKQSNFINDLLKDKKKLGLLILLLVGTVTVGTTAVIFNQPQEAPNSSISNSNNTTSTTVGSSSTVTSSAETSSAATSELINDFSFDDAEFVNALPLGFQPRRFVQGPDNIIVALGVYYIANIEPPIPQIVVLDQNYNILLDYKLDIGFNENVNYSIENNGNYSLMHGVMLENQDVLIFGQYRGHLLKSDSTKEPLGGIFADANIPTSVNLIYFFLKLEKTSLEVSLVEVVSNGSELNIYSGFVQDFIALGGDEFFISGQTQLSSGLFVNRPALSGGFTVGFLIKFSFVNGVITLIDDIYISNTGYTNVTRSVFFNGKIYFTGQSSGNGGNFADKGIPNANSTFPYIGIVQESTFTLTVVNPIENRIRDNTMNNSFMGNIAIGHGNKIVATVHGITADTHPSPNATVASVLEIDPITADIIEEYTIAIDNVSNYFIGKTESGYFLLGRTSATTSSFASNGGSDMLLVVLNQAFEISQIVIWGGTTEDAMQTWPLITSRGTLIFGVSTNSRDGTFASITEGTPANTYVSFFIELL